MPFDPNAPISKAKDSQHPSVRKVYRGGKFLVIDEDGETDVSAYVGMFPNIHDDRFDFEGWKP